MTSTSTSIQVRYYITRTTYSNIIKENNFPNVIMNKVNKKVQARIVICICQNSIRNHLKEIPGIINSEIIANGDDPLLGCWIEITPVVEVLIIVYKKGFSDSEFINCTLHLLQIDDVGSKTKNVCNQIPIQPDGHCHLLFLDDEIIRRYNCEAKVHLIQIYEPKKWQIK